MPIGFRLGATAPTVAFPTVAFPAVPLPAISLVTVAFLTITSLIGTACSDPDLSHTGDGEPGSHRSRVLLVGIDGATLRIAEPLMRAGRLPNLEKLALAGASGPLRSILPLRSPRIWTTIATGRLPEQHGILNFFYTEGGQRHLYDSTQRLVPALWNIASDRGLSVGVVNWWTTFPPEKINGVMISDHFLATHMAGIRELFHVGSKPSGPIAYPPDWLPEVSGRLESAPPVSRRPNPFANRDALPHWVERVPQQEDGDYLASVHRDDGLLTRLALEIETDLSPDLLMVLLLGIDRVSHVLWSVVEPAELYPEALRPSPEERRGGLAALESYYEYTDDLIGALLQRYGERDTVIVVSDHGFEADVSSDSVTGGHRGAPAIDGVLFARGLGIRPGVSSGSTRVADITPTVLAQLGLPVADDMQGRVAAFVETPVIPIASYADVPVEHLEGEASGAEERLIERLQALGYTDAPN